MSDISLRLGRDVLVVEGRPDKLLGRLGFADGFEGAGDCLEALNVAEPETIEEIHALYHAAGAHCALACTFGANAARLEAVGLSGKVSEICAAGVERARAARPEHLLAGIGPCGIDCAGDPAGVARAGELYREQAASLVAAGAEALLVADMRSLDDALCALAACREAKSVCTCGAAADEAGDAAADAAADEAGDVAADAAADVPIVVCGAFDESGAMLDSRTPLAQAAKALEEAGAAAVGLSGVLEAAQMVDALREMSAATSLPLVALPDASPAKRIGRDGKLYDASADLLALSASDLVAAGAALVGAWGHSLPVHIGALFAAVGGMSV